MKSDRGPGLREGCCLFCCWHYEPVFTLKCNTFYRVSLPAFSMETSEHQKEKKHSMCQASHFTRFFYLNIVI